MNAENFIEYFNKGDFQNCLPYIHQFQHQDHYVSAYVKNIVYYQTGNLPQAFDIASEYKDVDGIHQSVFKKIHDEIENLYPIPSLALNSINSTTRVIKIGGGARWIDTTLEKSQCRVTSMDSESERLGFSIDPDLLSDFHHIGELPKDSYDWVISSHVIEHLENPIKALLGSHKVLKPEGYIYSVLPLYTQTFDKHRQVTSLQHLIEDYESNKAGADWVHIDEFIRQYDCDSDLVFKGDRKKWLENFMLKPDRHTHYHVFDLALVFAMHGYCGFKCISIKELGNSIHYVGIKPGHST
ncbi:MAG: hypothetical protein RLZZ557_802 [Bacteroidota bacterium]